MAKAFVGASSNPGAPFSMAPGATQYVSLSLSLMTTALDVEAEANIKHRIAGTYMGLRTYIVTNTLTTASITVTSRKNSAAGNQSIVIAAGATGAFVDTANSDSIAVADDFCVSLVTAAGGAGTATWGDVSAVFSASSGHGAIKGACSGGQTYSGSGVNYYQPIAGNGSNSGAEALKQIIAGGAGTWSGLSVYVTSNGRITTTTVRFRINGAIGNQTFDIASGATGFFQDATNTDTTTTESDLVCMNIANGASGGALVIVNYSVQYSTTGTAEDIIASSSAGGTTRAAGASVTPYQVAGFIFTTTEANLQSRLQFATVAEHLGIYLSANTYSGSATLTFRKNGTDGNQSVAIGAGVTGALHDTTNTDSVASTDLLSFGIAGGTSGSITVNSLHFISMPIVGRSHAYIIG